jgi:hypothetical protein
MKSKKKEKIKLVPFGIASRIGDTIYINENLKKHNLSLYQAILDHEKEHSSGFELKDITLDLRNSHLKGNKLKYYGFILKNPGTLIEFVPIYRYDGTFVINPLLLLSYILLFFICLGVVS